MVKLIALDEEDLAVLSFYTHNAHLHPNDILWQKQQKRFLAPLYRFDWEKAATAIANAKAGKKEKKITPKGTSKSSAITPTGIAKRAPNTPSVPQEISAVLHFDRVLHVCSYGIDRHQKQRILTLKALCFRPKQAPAGIIEFVFDEKAKLLLEVECIEAMLTDLTDQS